MSSAPEYPRKPEKIAALKRREKALRENLHKRKEQARTRVNGQVESPAESANSGTREEEQ